MGVDASRPTNEPTPWHVAMSRDHTARRSLAAFIYRTTLSAHRRRAAAATAAAAAAAAERPW